jgi:single-stranded DNA-binding protein
MAKKSLITVTGYLGKDPETRQTQERTCEVTHRNEIAEMDETYEVTIPPRDYLIASLCVNVTKTEKRWYSLKVWNSDRLEHRAFRLAHAGDLVEVTGYLETIYLRDGMAFEQLIVQRYQRLRRSSKHRAPEIP